MATGSASLRPTRILPYSDRMSPARRLSLASVVALVVTLSLQAGCYFEGGIAYHPSLSQKVVTPRDPAVPGSTDTVVEGGGAGWSLGIKIGFYYDIPAKVTNIGLGVSPGSFNADGIAPFDEVVRMSGQGTVFRGDVIIPSGFISPKLQKRVTVSYSWLYDGGGRVAPESKNADAKRTDIRVLFAGVSVGGRPAWLARSLALFSLGVERFTGAVDNKDGRELSVTSTGVGARLMIVPRFIGTYQPGWYGGLPGEGSPGGSSNAGCHYIDVPDGAGGTKPKWHCE